jgi:hypothetical protein
MYVGVCIAERILKRPDVERKKRKRFMTFDAELFSHRNIRKIRTNTNTINFCTSCKNEYQ